MLLYPLQSEYKDAPNAKNCNKIKYLDVIIVYNSTNYSTEYIIYNLIAG